MSSDKKKYVNNYLATKLVSRKSKVKFIKINFWEINLIFNSFVLAGK
jgi:hypothetical protein